MLDDQEQSGSDFGDERLVLAEPGPREGKTRRAHDETVAVHSAAPTSVWRYLDPVGLVRALWRQRELIRQFTSREVLERNRGSHLGIVWNVLSPLFQLAAFTFVFGVLFHRSWGNVEGQSVHPTLDFVFNLFLGHTIFHIFAESMNRSPLCVATRPNFVRKVIFPVEILPVTVVFSGIIYEAIAMGLLLVLLTAVTGHVSPTLWTFPLVLVPLVMMCLGLSWFLASLGAFFRDIRNVTVVITQFAMFLSAIFYPISVIPKNIQWMVRLNPLVAIIESGRNAVISGTQPLWTQLGVITVVSFFVMLLGYAWFMKTKRGLADVV